METFKIFIVDDDPWYTEVLAYHLGHNPDLSIYKYETIKDCMAHMHLKPNLITLDYSLPDGNGSDALKKIKKANNQVPVIVISAQEDIGTAISLLKDGAHDYMMKDDNTKDLLWNAINHLREHQNLKQEVAQLKEELGQRYDLSKMIKGESEALQKVFRLIEKALKTNINISITGETGTGKEVVAQAIHYNSERKKNPFVAINMAAIPKELVESELFGHEKGAFTGAMNKKTGKFEEANNGTLFLDEIAEMDLSLQSKLLRVLQEREVIRVGGNDKVKLDVRLIIATHKNLAEEVKKGNFREDLYYRILGLPIALPPLRERGSDIILLAQHFADSFCKGNKMSSIKLTTGAKQKLMGYNYPGNVRELKAIMDLAVVMSDGKNIEAEDIQFNAISQNEVLLNEEKTLKAYTIEIIKHFLKKYDNNVVRVAEKLDIGKSTIYKMIQDKEIVL